MRFFLALLVALFLALPRPVAAQEDDRDRITRFLEDSLSGAGRAIRIEGFRGALSSRAEMDRLTIADDRGVWLTLTGIVIDWNRLAILSGNISVNELSAQEIILERPPVTSDPAMPSPEAQPFALPDLPMSIDIARVAAGRIVLGPTVLGQPVEGTLEAGLNLAGGEGRTSLRLQRTDGPEGLVSLQASYSNASQMLVVALDAREGAGGIAADLLDLPGQPAVQLVVNGSGPLSGFDANVTLATDGSPRLAGRIGINQAAAGATRFSADLGGDLAPLFLPEQAEFFGPEVRLAVAGSRDAAGRLNLSRLEVTARALTLSGSLELAADGLPARFDLTGQLGLASGEAVALPFAADVGMRLRGATLAARYDAAQGDGWSLRAEAEGVVRDDIAIDRLVLAGSGRIARRAGETAPPVFGGTLTLDAAGLVPADPALAEALGTALSGRFTFSSQSGEPLRVGEFTLNGADYGLTLRGLVEGITSGFTATGRVEGGFEDISRLSGLAGRPLSGAATLTATGSVTPWTGAFDITGQVAGQALSLGQAELDGLLRNRSTIDLSVRRDATGTLLRNLAVAAGPAMLAARGTLATAGSDLYAEFDLPDLTVLGEGYGGGLNAVATLKGTPEDAAVTLRGTGRSLRTGQAELDRLLAGTTALDLALTRTGDRIGIDKAEIANAGLRAQVTGHYAPAGSDLTAVVDMADLAVLGRGYAGGLDVTATLQGTPDNARATLRGTGRSLRLGQPELDGLLAGDTALDVAITRVAERIGIERASFANPNAQVQVTGHYDPAGSDLSATARVNDLSRLGNGWRGAASVEGSFAGTPEDGRLTVTGTSRDLAIGQPEADRLLAGTSDLNLALALRDRLVEVDRASLSNPQLQASATGRIEEGGRRAVALSARLANMALVVPDFPGPLTVAGELAQPAPGAPYDVDLRAQGPGGIDATARGTVAETFATANLRLAGSAQAGLANLFLGQRAVAGQIGFDLSLNGAPGLAALSGPVRLTGGRLSDPALPFALTDIGATATLGGGAARIEAAAALSTGGRVTAQGSLGLAAPYNADLAVTLSGATLRDPTLYEATLGGRLTVTGPLTGGGTVAGRIDVAGAELVVPSTGLGGTGQIPDLRHVGEPAAVRATRARAGLLGDGSGGGAGGSGRLNLDITVSAPARVFIRGRGLDAELGGEVHLGGNTAAVVPSGGLQLIRGRLDILGKRLVLDRAELVLQGDLLPTVDIAASNDSDGVVTTVAIAGPATEPVISFTSLPELPQEEVLARLLFNRDLASISPLQAAQLAAAVATLAGRGGEGIIGRLRKGFGLDDLDVASDGEGGTRVRAGKYIAENVYTEVEVDQGGTSRINLNLDLRPGVKLKGRVNSEGEAGLGLFLERDY